MFLNRFLQRSPMQILIKPMILAKIHEGFNVRDFVRNELKANKIALPANLPDSVNWKANDDETILAYSELVGVLTVENEDIRSLKELLTYGLKGMAAYAEHAYNLGYKNDDVFAFIHSGLTATENEHTADELVALVLECGKYGVDTMALLDKANTESYGNPEITEVNLGVLNNPAILISGHDLKDMEELLKQTEGTGVDVYTHSEMLPANYYPAFKKYEHFVGNYGNAWWKQKEEFASFNGPVLFTTNCIVPPKSSYMDRIYTTGSSGFEGMYSHSRPQRRAAERFLSDHRTRKAPARPHGDRDRQDRWWICTQSGYCYGR